VIDKLGVVGAGSWGTALAIALAPRFREVALWTYEADLAAGMERTRENSLYLPGFQLPANVRFATSLEAVVSDAATILGVMPSQFARPLYQQMRPFIAPSAIAVSATKGLENGTLLRMSEVAAEALGRLGGERVAVLSGPTFAREIAAGEPAAVVIASNEPNSAAEVQRRFATPVLRFYTNIDPIGVEIGAALKNVVAIGAGVCQGLGLGSNTMAALITRGLAEITRLAVAMGGLPSTLAGLAGLGDLVLTCTGNLSRNRQVGIELARGRTIAEIVGSMRMVAEGVKTTGAAVELAGRHQVEMPITTKMNEVLHQAKPPRIALKELMERSLKGE
jgi:glycerol-3-phosphate dehydrogenase (NAD(P)+)